MTNYNLHSVRIEDEVWARVKASGVSVNQMLRKALGLPFSETRRVTSSEPAPDTISAPRLELPPVADSSAIGAPRESSTHLPGKATIETYRRPLREKGNPKR